MSTACHHHRRLLLNPPPVNTIKPSRSMSRNSHFDSNMMLILAAMLCSLIAALVLNSIVRCALRCRRRFAFDSPDGVATRLASTGLKKDALIQIPIVVFKSGIDTPEIECPICLGEFGEGEEVRILPKCNHSFHVKCIDTWLASHSSCPTCRQLLIGNPSRV